ncbi:hypothetical protein HARCEL1_12080 [Halococcoides cellulosivorans]|uniref:HTH cro/C1-type domain-containing protein n=2 Tax=Halococcoides cellulosivorans TaxID=1679096 RepID=A0A2R4X4L2_9EURY|nr:hypothetical protein HARCEL1_12080 [Halococcoides cellulosivorans]
MHDIVSAINGSDTSVDHEKLEPLLQSSLKHSRDQAGLTQGELADKAGVSQPLISRIENQDLNPRVSTLRSLLEYLDPLPTDKTTTASTTAASTSETSLLTEIQSDFDELPGKDM